VGNTDSWADRVEMAVAVVLQFGIGLVTVSALTQSQWLVAFNGTLVLLLSFAPAIIERRLRVPLPVELTLVTCVFLYASFALGEVRDFYERIWWWDLALHGLSALTIGIIGFLSIYVFYMTQRIRVAAGWIATITFALAVSVGTIWEIFEFLMDWYFGFNMQKSGLEDTMTDLLINSAGAAVAAAIGYFYVYDEDSLLGRRLIQALEHHKNKSGGNSKS
jgi:VanZ family protein